MDEEVTVTACEREFNILTITSVLLVTFDKLRDRVKRDELPQVVKRYVTGK